MSTIRQVSSVNGSDIYNVSKNIIPSTSAENTKENVGVILELSENANADGVVVKKSNVSTTATGGVVSTMSLTQSEMVEMQSCLQTLGFLDGFIGFDENNTTFKKAVSNFQKTYALSESGVINSATKNKLRTLYSRYGELNHSAEMNEIGSVFYHDNEGLQRDSFIKTFIFLEDMGLTIEQIAGVMGNMHAESAIIPDNLEGNDEEHDPTYALNYSTTDNTGFGLLQWTDEARKKGLKAMAESMAFGTSNQDIANALNNINVQLAYFRQEMTTTEIAGVNYTAAWDRLLDANSYTEAADIFLEEIEQPSNIQEKYADRRKYAGWIYEILGDI